MTEDHLKFLRHLCDGGVARSCAVPGLSFGNRLGSAMSAASAGTEDR